MSNESKLLYVVVDPHIFHYKKIVKKILKGEKHYFRYEALFEFLLARNQLAILYTGYSTSFRGKITKKVFLTKFFNKIEFYLWIIINRIPYKKIQIFRSVNHVTPQNSVIYDLGVGWNSDKERYLFELSNFKGLSLINMTHYNRNAQKIFEVIPQLKYPIVISEGHVTSSRIFKLLYKDYIPEIHVPFVIDHLNSLPPPHKSTLIGNNVNSNLENIKRKNLCLMMGSIGPHLNKQISEITHTTFLNPDRATFRSYSFGMPYFAYEPDISDYQHNFSKRTIDQLYSEYTMFFTGVEIVQIPSMNVLEGMYFGCAYIGPDDKSHEILGLVNNKNYFAYKLGDFENFLDTVKYLVANPILVNKVAREGQKYILTNFTGEKIYEGFLLRVSKSHRNILNF